MMVHSKEDELNLHQQGEIESVRERNWELSALVNLQRLEVISCRRLISKLLNT